jgi:hypothetical protein
VRKLWLLTASTIRWMKRTRDSSHSTTRSSCSSSSVDSSTNLSQTDALGRVGLKDAFEEVAEQAFLPLGLEGSLVLEMLCQFVAALAPTPDFVENVDALEGEVAEQQVVEQHSQRPHIRLPAVALSRQDLRRHVDLRAAVGDGGLLVADGAGQPEVADLAQVAVAAPAVAGLADEDVLELDVAVDDVVLVDVLQPVQDLQADQRGLFHPKHFPRLPGLQVVQVALVAVLHDKEVPVSLCVGGGVPSKVLSNLTILGWSSMAMVLISCRRKRLSCGSLIILRLEMHLMA